MNDEAVGNLMSALAHPLRRAILRAMSGGGCAAPSDLAPKLEESLGQVNYHFKVLRKAGAITFVEAVPAKGSVKHLFRFSLNVDWALVALGLSDWRCSEDTWWIKRAGTNPKPSSNEP